MAAFANEPLHKDSLLVTILRDLGAVFYVKTNVPVAMMMAETNNNVWGECRNPLHKYLSPGGSSGGEGALIALKASPLGIGTDIGGSIRIPAAWCNLYGLKPSFGRYPHYGAKPGIAGQEYILSVNGPMSRSLRTLKLYSEAVLSEQSRPWDYDHKCIPIPWRENVIQPPGRKLRLGLIGIDDGLVTVHPPVERALNMTKVALERQGHEVIPWSTEDHEAIVKVGWNTCCSGLNSNTTARIYKLHSLILVAPQSWTLSNPGMNPFSPAWKATPSPPQQGKANSDRPRCE